ncbi:flagellar basal-body rod protein FlgF [Permianibacter sp. IMCC34836]|uniref:flagellar basal-body rod protein FlgF n=1 Tax=Permianibacter fluminis TaxID=2738515 RepID=UPI00155481EA|nr:flagellar basal-body rod protein FlgF [Permianibacter fluminis]NQD38068.1 flagellar basal-body rod protein FlgF [Permianibacter fluminis]
MDRLLYIAMTGAKETTLAQAKSANNLAHASVTGFKADLAQARAMPIFGNGMPSRAFVMTERPGTDFNHGSLITTGNDFDIAIKGNGFLAVQDAKGGEAYTRAGELRINAAGLLETSGGRLVLGNGGPVQIPANEKLDIGSDGTLSIRPQGAPASAVVVLDRLRLVNPDLASMRKGEDGLFRQESGAPAAPDANVQIVQGVLESSNVNAVEEMVDMITLARQFEVNVKMMRISEDNDSSLERLVQM